MLNNVLTTVIFFICFLSFILIFSLMQTDVEERKYEFGVLRTLGLRNASLVTLISLQTLIFAIPAILAGFSFMRVLVYGAKINLQSMTHLEIDVIIKPRTIYIGLFTGLVIPFISNIIPIK